MLEATKHVSAELDRIVDIVKEFYRVLGKRNWVFFDALNLDRVEKIVSMPSPQEAESELISYLKEQGTLEKMITMLNCFPEMRPRLDLLRKAEQDYLSQRYYSSVLVTVSVMDGFVNDLFKDERRGLHARTPEDMRAEDCIAAIWEGLPSVQQTFTKSVHKRIDEPIYEVYRHAIMHGMATDFDNDVVASKAWCMLFAVCDWAKAKLKSRDVSEKPVDLKQALADYVEIQKRNDEQKKRLAKWKPHVVDLDNPSAGDVELINDCESFFTAWVSKNYGELGSFFPNSAGYRASAQAGKAREYYAPHPITGFVIERINRTAASVAQVKARVASDNGGWVASIRFVRFDGDNLAADWESGKWKVMQYATSPFIDVGESANGE